ncbi:hypothetical protein WG906_15970 [Pedobacter sp. P351]|uniref:hypothetical protein n=1 Tax=Pedobacter superstes TaxID=3133441 RepID=UPI00309B851D
MPAAFTICSNNYLAKARVAAETFLASNAGYEFYIFLVDECISEIDYDFIKGVKITAIKDIVGNIDELAVKYSIVELNTAVKPAIFSFLFKQYQHTHIFYLDPDLMIFDRFSEIEELFEEKNCNIIVTPHFCSPIDDGKIPSEVHFSLYGLYNLGFLAVKQCPESQKFLDWWHDRLMKYCFIDVQNGMFTDQIWVNYAPIFFDGVYILKHLGYNMANWNLYERELNKIDEKYYVNNYSKLKFFHFSHYKFHNPYILSSQQNRHNIDELPHIRQLIDLYQSKLIRNNQEYFSTIPCHYQQIYESAHNQDSLRETSLRNLMRRLKNKVLKAGRS